MTHKELAQRHHTNILECIYALRLLADITRVVATRMSEVAKDFKDYEYRYSSDPDMLRLELQIVTLCPSELKDMADDMMYWINSRYQMYKEIKENGVKKNVY